MEAVACGLLLLAAGLAQNQTVAAQEPFSTIGVQLHATSNLNRTQFHDGWKPGKGGGLSVSTPFYWGMLEFGGTVHRYNSTGDYPGFGVVWINAGLDARWGLTNWLLVRPGFRLGNYRMSFDDAESSFHGLSNESELTTGAGLLLQFSITNSIAITSRVDYIRVHTQPLLHYWYLSGGIAFSFPAGRSWIALWE